MSSPVKRQRSESVVSDASTVTTVMDDGFSAIASNPLFFYFCDELSALYKQNADLRRENADLKESNLVLHRDFSFVESELEDLRTNWDALLRENHRIMVANLGNQTLADAYQFSVGHFFDNASASEYALLWESLKVAEDEYLVDLTSTFEEDSESEVYVFEMESEP